MGNCFFISGDRIGTENNGVLRLDRTRMYKIQNNHGETDLYHHIDEIERESERFRQDALIDEFLTAELALCRMVQRINWTLIEELHFDMEIDMELVKEE